MHQQQGRAGQRQDGQGHDFTQTAPVLHQRYSDTSLEDTVPEEGEGEECSKARPSWIRTSEEGPRPEADEDALLAEVAACLKEIEAEQESLRLAETNERAAAAHRRQCKQYKDVQWHGYAQVPEQQQVQGTSCAAPNAVEYARREYPAPEDIEEFIPAVPLRTDTQPAAAMRREPRERYVVEQPWWANVRLVRLAEQANSDGRLRELTAVLEALQRTQVAERAEEDHHYQMAAAHAKALEHSECAEGLGRQISEVQAKIAEAEAVFTRAWQQAIDAEHDEREEARDGAGRDAPPQLVAGGDPGDAAQVTAPRSGADYVFPPSPWS